MLCVASLYYPSISQTIPLQFLAGPSSSIWSLQHAVSWGSVLVLFFFLSILNPQNITETPLQLNSICISASLTSFYHLFRCCYCPVAKSCPTLYDPMACSTPGSLVLHYLPEFTHTHVHWVHDAFQSSHSVPPHSRLALCLSQHHGLFQWVSSLHQEAKALNIQGWFPSGLTSLISL